MNEPLFRQKDADELHAVTGAIFGTWERDPETGGQVRAPGILERLEGIESALKRWIGLAAAVAGGGGAIAGSLLTHVVEAVMRMHG